MILAGLLGLGSCYPEIEVLAPEKEIYIVYCILDPDLELQTVKISKAFQYEGDAYLYAAQNDLTLKGLEVTLEGDGKTRVASQVNDQPKEEGDFLPSQTLYKFKTAGADTLFCGLTYTLHIRKPGVPDFHLMASTEIPNEPVLDNPRGPYLLPDGIYINPTLDFDDDMVVEFQKVNASGYELRIFVNYLEDGEKRTCRWGPTQVFTGSVQCGFPLRTMCYKIPENTVALRLKNIVDDAEGVVEYVEGLHASPDPALLNRSCRLEATAIDSNLTQFLGANTSFGFGLNMLMDKPDISNITGGDAIGILGSIHRSSGYFNLGSCTQKLAGFIDPLFPIPGCEW